MKVLNGTELAGFIKERQAHQVAALPQPPKLTILRDSDNPVIAKYVGLKQRYGEDIGVTVIDQIVPLDDLPNRICEITTPLIVQLPLTEPQQTDAIVGLIQPELDVDNLTGHAPYDAATPTAINWLLAGYDIDLKNAKIAIVGRGRLVGKPLEQMWVNSGYDVTVFEKGDDLTKLKEFDIIVTATGVPHLISNDMIKSGAVVVDAGTASENGVIVGDVDNAVRERQDLLAITPVIGGVGPLTVSALFENVITATLNQIDR